MSTTTHRERTEAAHNTAQSLFELNTALFLLLQDKCSGVGREDRAIYGIAEQAEAISNRLADDLDDIQTLMGSEQGGLALAAKA